MVYMNHLLNQSIHPYQLIQMIILIRQILVSLNLLVLEETMKAVMERRVAIHDILLQNCQKVLIFFSEEIDMPISILALFGIISCLLLYWIIKPPKDSHNFQTPLLDNCKKKIKILYSFFFY